MWFTVQNWSAVRRSAAQDFSARPPGREARDGTSFVHLFRLCGRRTFATARTGKPSHHTAKQADRTCCATSFFKDQLFGRFLPRLDFATDDLHLLRLQLQHHPTVGLGIPLDIRIVDVRVERLMPVDALAVSFSELLPPVFPIAVRNTCLLPDKLLFRQELLRQCLRPGIDRDASGDSMWPTTKAACSS